MLPIPNFINVYYSRYSGSDCEIYTVLCYPVLYGSTATSARSGTAMGPVLVQAGMNQTGLAPGWREHLPSALQGLIPRRCCQRRSLERDMAATSDSVAYCETGA